MIYFIYESVMKPKLCNKQGIFFNFINHPVFIVYSSGPITGQSMLEESCNILHFSIKICG